MAIYTQTGGNMADREVRMRIPEALYKRFKIICVDQELSLPKQTTELIRKFVEIRESDQRLEYECSKK